MGDSNFGELLFGSFRSAFANILSYLPVMLVFALLSTVLTLLFSSWLTSALNSGGGVFLVQLTLTVIAQVLFAAYQLFITALASDAYNDAEPSLPEAGMVALTRTPTMVAAAFLSMIPIGIGLLLCGFPAIIVAVFLSLTAPCVALGDEGPIGSMRESFELVQGNWLQTFLLFMVCGFLISIPMFLIMLPLFFLGVPAVLEFAKDWSINIFGILMFFLAALFGYFFWNFTIILATHIYKDYSGESAGGSGATGGSGYSPASGGSAGSRGWGSLPIRRR